jgi:hypothetical protein
MQATATKMQYQIQGEAFGARGCSSSCTCNPCNCNPCNCAGRQPDYPRWRVNGYALQGGQVADVDISHRLILSLAQPRNEHELSGAWSEVILVDNQATDEQIATLLELFEVRLTSIPAELGLYRVRQRAVYKVPMQYTRQDNITQLSLSFHPERDQLVRNGDAQVPTRAWDYQGPMAISTIIHHS